MPNEIKKKIAQQIDKAPEPLRSYIHMLEAGSPADILQENAQLRSKWNSTWQPRPS